MASGQARNAISVTRINFSLEALSWANVERPWMTVRIQAVNACLSLSAGSRPRLRICSYLLAQLRLYTHPDPGKFLLHIAGSSGTTDG